MVGILGCGAIANIITNFAAEGKLGVDLKFFYDRDMERAENMASQVDGIVVLNINDMLDHVDLVIESASPQVVMEVVSTHSRKRKRCDCHFVVSYSHIILIIITSNF